MGGKFMAVKALQSRGQDRCARLRRGGEAGRARRAYDTAPGLTSVEPERRFIECRLRASLRMPG